jgi:hypothetical protein
MKLLSCLVAICIASVPIAGASQSTGPEGHSRHAEAVDFASAWVDLVDDGKADEALGLLSPTFQRNLTAKSWRDAIAGTRAQLGARQSKSLRRIVWYENPQNAPLPGLYAAVEFDSVFDNAGKHFRYVILHSQDGAPFKVMRNEATFALDKSIQGRQ